MRTPLTTVTLAARLGVHPVSIGKARRRLGITELNRESTKLIAENITPGKGQSPLGRWPKGKRRHDLPGWASSLKELARVTKERISIKAASRRVGVSDRTMRRWLCGLHVPSPARAAKVRSLIRQLDR